MDQIVTVVREKEREEDKMAYDVAESNVKCPWVHGSTWDDSKDDSKDRPMSSSGYPSHLGRFATPYSTFWLHGLNRTRMVLIGNVQCKHIVPTFSPGR